MGFVNLQTGLVAASAALGLVLTPLAIMAARSAGLVDKPNARKVHKRPIPRIGGVAIALATLLPLIVLFATTGLIDDSSRPVVTLLIGSASIALIGLLDDVFEVSSKYKLLALLAASGAFCASGGAIQGIVLSGEHWLDLGIAAWPVTMLWIALVTVSINFIDGLDGLAAGLGLITAAVIATGAAVGGDQVSLLVMLALIGSLGSFLIYNTHPAKVFMGDCGSMFIGFLLAGTCAMASGHVGSTRGVLLPALTLSVPLVDTLLTMVRRRVLQRRSVFAAERGHVHHRLLDTGLRHFHVVLILYTATLSAAAVSLICIFGGYVMAMASVAVVMLGIMVLFRVAGSVRARETLSAVRRNRALDRENRRFQHAFYDLQLQFREVSDFSGWWKMVCRAAEVFDFAKLDLPLTRRDGSQSTLRWRRDGEMVADANSITAEVPIPQRRLDQTLRASIEVVVSEFLESGGYRVALFSRLMSEFGLKQLDYKIAKNEKKTTSEAPVESRRPQFEPGSLPDLKIAIVHDFLYTYAGAERVLEQMLQVFPQASLFSLFDFLPEDQRGFIGNRPVHSSFVQRLPLARKKHRAYLPLMPLAIEQLDLSEFDLVLSSSYVAAKGVITRPDQLHVCYCHTPIRFAWDLQNQYLGQVGLKRGVRSILAKLILHYMRNWDVRSAYGVDAFITNSDFVGRRVQKVYRRQSMTIYPPVDTDFFSPGDERDDFYMTASRLVPYKRIDLIVKAFAAMPERKLVVVGEGPEMARIKEHATPNVQLVGFETAESLRRYMRRAKAFVFAAEEDFGIAPVEAQGCGTPVIAFGRGGVTESVIDGQTGLFFREQTVESIVKAVDEFESKTWDHDAIRERAQAFSAEQFRKRFGQAIIREWQKFGKVERSVDKAANLNPSVNDTNPAAAV